METNVIHTGETRQVLATIPNESVDCVITSPPYWGLRDYGNDMQIGLEKDPQEYVAHLVEVFDEVRRVLKPQGTLWLNIGDSYIADRKGGSQGKNGQRADRRFSASVQAKTGAGLKNKDIAGIPWRVAFALQDAGWYLRQDIIWHKPNCMPESVQDRCTRNHEYVFLLAKNAEYFYDNDTIKERAVSVNDPRLGKGRIEYSGKRQGEKGTGGAAVVTVTEYRNKRSVWTVTTKPFNEAHFATFPEDLIEPMVLAGCPKGGVVLDPFVGSGTTAVVAYRLQRKYIGIELNPEYAEMARRRVSGVTTPIL